MHYLCFVSPGKFDPCLINFKAGSKVTDPRTGDEWSREVGYNAGNRKVNSDRKFVLKKPPTDFKGKIEVKAAVQGCYTKRW